MQHNQILSYANDLFHIFTVEPLFEINLEDKTFIHGIKKSLQRELCRKQTQNHNWAYRKHYIQSEFKPTDIFLQSTLYLVHGTLKKN
jgi:hypothetical protein